jgi:hypothetical protein
MTSPPILVTGGRGRCCRSGRQASIRAGALYPPPGTGATLGHRSWLEFLAGKPAGRPAA